MERAMDQQLDDVGKCAFKWDQRLTAIASATAEHFAQKVGKRRGLSQADREDLRQDILLALVRRAHGFAGARGAWSTYVKLVAQHAVADLEHVRARVPLVADIDGLALDIADPHDLRHDVVLRLDLARTLDALPPHLVAVIALIAEHGSVAAAQRVSAIPTCAFSRHIADIRMWLRVAGLAPPS